MAEPSTSPTPREPPDDLPRWVLVAASGLLIGLVALYGYREYARRFGGARATQPAPSSQPVVTLPPTQEEPSASIAWEADAQAPVIVAVDDDGIEDFVGFFRAWDGRSAWITYAGAFRGKNLDPVWRSEPLDPWIVRTAGVVPTAVAAGDRVVIADTSPTVRVYKVASGDKDWEYKLGDVAAELCASPDGNHVWVRVADTRDDKTIATSKTVPHNDTLLDLSARKATTAAPRPKWCPPRTDAPVTPSLDGGRAGNAAQLLWAACHEDFRNRLAHASCAPATGTPKADGFAPSFVLKDGTWSVAVGSKSDDPSTPMAMGFGADGKSAWQSTLAVDPSTKGTAEVAHIAELSGDTLYVVYDKVYFDERLGALDAKTGERRWDVPLVDSLPRVGTREGRGPARALVVSTDRVYVPRAGGGLDVFDAKGGGAVGMLGRK